MVKCNHSDFFLTDVILYEIPISTTVIYCYLKKRVTFVYVKAIIALFTFADIFAV